MFLSEVKSLVLLNANNSPRSFFPGKSIFFWLLIIIGFYIYYLYSVSKNKKDFFKSGYIQSVSLAVVLFFLSFIAINVFLDNPRKGKENVSQDVDEKVQLLILADRDNKMHDSLDVNFSQTDFHYRYLLNHFEVSERWEQVFKQPMDDNNYTLINFYLDKLEYSDSIYRNNARLALGIIFYKQKDIPTSLSYFNAISQNHFPYVESFRGNAYLSLRDTTDAITYFKKATEVSDPLRSESKHQLITLLEAKNNDAELFELFQLDSYRKYFSFEQKSRLFFLNNKIVEYFEVVLLHRFSNFKWTGLIAALGILLAWFFYMVRLDIFEKEGYSLLILTLLGGMIFGLGCFYLYDFLQIVFGFSMSEDNLFMYCVFGIGVVEELVKIIPLLIVLLVTRNVINEPYDYILYAAVSALGFSFMENILYFDGDLSSIHGRGLTSVPGHIIDSSIVAYGLVLAKYRYKKLPSVVGFIAFFLLGVINHGLYDYWLFKGLIIFFITGFLISVSLWIIIMNNCINNSPSFKYLVAPDSNRTQMILSFSLIGILVMEYVIVAWENGPDYANDSFNSNLIIAGVVIAYYSSILTNIDFVKGYWATVPFKTINDKKSGTEFDIRNFLLRLVSGDTFSYSFVHLDVVLAVHPQNDKLQYYFNTQVRGKITDRMIVTCIPSEGKVYQDPFWFRIDMERAIDVGGAIEQTFLFRFEKNRPSFDRDEELVVYLFALKNKEELNGSLKRENFRALGRVIIRKC